MALLKKLRRAKKAAEVIFTKLDAVMMMLWVEAEKMGKMSLG